MRARRRLRESAATLDAPPEVVRGRSYEGVTGRVVEARGRDEHGHPMYRVQLIAYGESRNGRHYSEQLLRAAAPLYEGAKAYDHHRSPEEVRASTITGLAGYYVNVTPTAVGLEADLHLLPGATHAAEALDASLSAQLVGLTPLVGISHDVLAMYRPVQSGGRAVQEATQIVKVNSADLVADPAAGGQAVRMLAAGSDRPGDGFERLFGRETPEGRARVVRHVSEAGLSGPERDVFVAETDRLLPEQFTEGDLQEAYRGAWKSPAGKALAGQELEQMRRGSMVNGPTVGPEAREKKLQALDAFFSPAGRGGGYRTLREAYLDITGHRPSFLGADLNRQILADSFGAGYASVRGTESLDSGSWAQVLGDSVTRIMIAEYSAAHWGDWRNIVSNHSFGVDFRSQRRGRVGGFGLLPVVPEGAPYQPLASPPDEEATYALSKKGGTEDLTLEMIANDDVDAVRRIPLRLGRSAAITLYRFVFDLLDTNAVTTYDSTALFHANHSNTDVAALSSTALALGRQRMRRQAAFGAAEDLLSIVPRWLIVPSELEELAWQLVTSLVQVTASQDATVPNLHHSMRLQVVDYFTDDAQWYLVADPVMVPTIELGFYTNSPDPELFTQSDPNSGSVFNADVITWKIRHIYSGAVLDHRGFYRGASI